jgi:hypothetical protein
MNPLIGIAAALFPEIIKLIAGDKGGDIGSAVVKAVTDATGAQTAEAAKAKVDADPKAAADLQVKLAQIALDARKAEADAAEKERQAALESQRLQAEAEQKRRQSDLEANKLSMAETTEARTALRDLTLLDTPLAWTPAVISYIIISGFFVVVLMLMFGVVKAPAATDNGAVNVIQILNICIGSIAAGFATVINFWLGSSLGSQNKDASLIRSSTVAQVKELTRDKLPEVPPEKKTPDEGPVKPEPSLDLGPSKSFTGKMSVFGGPNDTGMAADEGLALFEHEDIPAFKDLFLDGQPPQTTGLGRRLNPEAYYLACRWDYGETPRAFLRTIKARVSNPRTGKAAVAQPVDWGPNQNTGRVADLSPGLAAFLGLETNQVCQVVVPLPSLAASREQPVIRRLQVLSLSGIEAKFGKFQYEEAAGGRIRILGTWVADNITTIDIPQLAGLQPGHIQCHRLVAKQLADAFAEVERRGLLDRILAWDGLFVPRHKTWNPARSLSPHSWGIAFDINARWNGYGAEPAPKGGRGSVVELVPIFEKFGFAWGGYFSRGSTDGMHFECCETV